jgi:hypothetical protein
MRLSEAALSSFKGIPCFVHMDTYKEFNCSFDLMKAMSLLVRYLTKGKASFIFPDKIDDAI